MVYASLTFWLLVVVLLAWGIQQLWSGLVKPKVINTLLLPGTLIAQLGHVLGLLVTGATVNNTTLIKDDDSGDPETTQDARPRIPVVGPIAIALLPLLACAGAILIVTQYFGQSVLAGTRHEPAAYALPLTLTGMWQLMRDLVTMTETLVDTAATIEPRTWQLWLFGYLMICFTVRMAPFPGNFRGSLGAILLMGVLAMCAGAIFDGLPERIEAGWQILSLTVATLLLLLLISAVVRGTVGLIKLVAANA